ncbi:MucBP domain-containing protein, partial [Enterococcus sp.]|uniref:MucBP domain-containing protein n=1 Tax=Enterococcus sp. TaxID=35783 RepID=UPI002906318B
KTATTQTVEHGKAFSMNAPGITGYTVVPADKTKSIASVSKNETVTFNYTKNVVPVTKYTITVKYIDTATNNEIQTATKTEIEKGKTFSIAAPSITGYTVKDADKTKTIASVSKNETVTINYTKNKYTITIKYIDENGTSIKTATTQTVEHGKPFYMAAPTITGYTVVPADKTKSIDSVIKNESLTFKYTKDAIKYNVKVIHLGNDDKQLGVENFPVEAGTKYTVKSKTFDGYKLSGNPTKDVTVTKDMEVTFTYNNLAFDVIKIDVIADGTYLKTVTKTVLPNEKVEVSNQILDLDPKEFDLAMKFYYNYTGVGGATRKYSINVSRFLVRYMPDSELPIMKKTILDRVNKLRQEEGVPLLKEDTQLSSVAAMRSGELKSRFSHTRPNGYSYTTAVDAAGITYVAIGENVARLPSQLTSGVAAGNEMFEMWEASSGHRKNMVDPSYQYIGIGLEVHGVTVYGTQLFIRK